jgi:hypothetical protein
MHFVRQRNSDVVQDQHMDYVGYVDELTRFYVSGWVADRDDWRSSLTIDIIVNETGVGTCVADRFRQSLDALHPDATGRYEFRFYFAGPLSMFAEQNVKVRVSGTGYYLIRDRSVLSPIRGDDGDSTQRPFGPIVVSTMGRTGSTALMAVLNQHPNIVVAGRRPYEVELGSYYAYALRTFLAAGDHERSLRTDDITAVANRFHTGFNPYFANSFANVFKETRTLERFMTERLPARFGRTFRDIILDYYEEVAIDQNIERPIYFAEKSLPERDSRLGFRFIFPNIREIVLVRDLRDVVCSAVSSNRLAFARVVEDTAASARQMLAITGETSPNTITIRYEDFILDKPGTMSRLFAFLGLTTMMLNEEALTALFSDHGTSSTPIDSLGRWKRDLTGEQQGQFGVFDDFLRKFGYI